ncbi:hypothetical protein PFISCL1PPCAC_20874, partial [Pristionchus fissidentatus]
SSCLFVCLLLTLTEASPCPDGYKQVNGGDCFRVGLNEISSFDDAEADCNADGGMLASIHNPEENAAARDMECYYSVHQKLIGIRCVGIDCKWTDGTPLDYFHFAYDDAPIDNGQERCYSISDYDGMWYKTSLMPTEGRACWMCRIKAKTITCNANEVEYKGGCVFVQTTPANQSVAENSCPGQGGHLISIHSDFENSFYQSLASSAGITGSIYLGGKQYSDKDLSWLDQTFYDYHHFTPPFPNSAFGDCVQMMLSNEFGTLGQWTNVDCITKLPYICYRDGTVMPTTPVRLTTTTTTSIQPLASPNCPSVQYFNKAGKIYSPNFPLSIPAQQRCEYVISTDRGTLAHIKFPVYDCESGTKLTVYDGLDSEDPLLYFTSTAPNPSRLYAATSNIIKLVFEPTDNSSPVGTGWEAEFFPF